MKHFIIIISILFIYCTPKEVNNKVNIMKEKTKTIKYMENDQDFNNKTKLISIPVSLNSSINWNVENNEIEEDSCYKNIFKNKQKYFEELVNNISNKDKTMIAICYKKKSYITVGNIAYLLLEKLYKFSRISVIKYQLDLVEPKCIYPIGFFNVLEKDSEIIKKRIRKKINNE